MADLSVGILCIPFTVLYFEFTYWPFGYALCKIIPAAQAMSVMASIGTLTAISIGKSFSFHLLKIPLTAVVFDSLGKKLYVFQQSSLEAPENLKVALLITREETH